MVKQIERPDRLAVKNRALNQRLDQQLNQRSRPGPGHHDLFRKILVSSEAGKSSLASGFDLCKIFD